MKWIKTYEAKLGEKYLELHYGNMNKETEDIIVRWLTVNDIIPNSYSISDTPML